MDPVKLALYQDSAAARAFAMHDRLWQHNRYVYPVVSRRSKGISIGVNLNPDKICNFDCIYCSIDRTTLPAAAVVDLARLERELSDMLSLVRSGEIYRFDPFDKIPAPLRRINDIAFSGDGEPTTFADFPQAVKLAARLKDGLPDVKLVLITNATMFHRPTVQEALALLDRHNGEIWAKLDAGTSAYYDLIDRTSVPFRRILENLHWAARQRPIVIQSLFMRVRGELPPEAELHAYIDRLEEIVAAGGRIKLVQVYTVARTTAEAYATALSSHELDRIAGMITAAHPALPVEIYP